MKILSYMSPLKIVSVCGLVLGLSVSQVSLANEHVSECKNHVQNKIAWNYNGKTQWEEKNLAALCKDTTAPKEPGECFNKIMHGKVNWGSSDQWEWKNALSLCSGSNNSDATVTCFKKRIEAKENWNTAILECQLNTKNNNKIPM
ncbi:MAG: hypothetical protein D4R63_12675 [Methylococcaceae bacterium]|nr:MAG: hypothetical protein D4R63_12675 [Methylococcaceae bacterium]